MLATSPRRQGKSEAGGCVGRFRLQLDSNARARRWRGWLWFLCPGFHLVERRRFGVVRLGLASLVVVLQQLVDGELRDRCRLPFSSLFRLADNSFIRSFVMPLQMTGRKSLFTKRDVVFEHASYNVLVEQPSLSWMCLSDYLFLLICWHYNWVMVFSSRL